MKKQKIKEKHYEVPFSVQVGLHLGHNIGGVEESRKKLNELHNLSPSKW